MKTIDLGIKKPKSSGFTLAETLAVIILVGVIASLAVPNFFKFIANYTLKSSANDLYQAVSRAQAYSVQRRENWQFSLRTSNGVLQYAVHRATLDPNTNATSIQWNSLPSNINLNSETNLSQPTSGIYQVCFSDQGLPSTPSGSPQSCTYPASFNDPQQITLGISGLAQYRRCIIISTLLGALTTGQEQATPNSNGKSCY